MSSSRKRTSGPSNTVRTAVVAGTLAVLSCFGAAAGLANASDSGEAGMEEEIASHIRR